MTDAAVTMDLYPQPAAGLPKPWAFPAPDRGVLANGLTVLRCHRPRQQLVAVEICLDVPLDAEPGGLDGIASIMVNALSQGAGELHRRRVLRRAGALRCDPRRAGRLRRRAPVAGGSPLPPAPGAGAAGRGPARPDVRRQRGRAAGAQPAGRDPDRAGRPRPAGGPAARAGAVPGVRADVPAPQGHRGHRRADRRGGRARPSTPLTCGPPRPPRSSWVTWRVSTWTRCWPARSADGPATAPSRWPCHQRPPTTPAGW